MPSEVPEALEQKPAKSAAQPQHEVGFVATSSHMACAAGDSHEVNSVHHQAVVPAHSYRTLASPPDHVTEAIEANTPGFAVGVQWHPESGVSPINKIVWDGCSRGSQSIPLVQ
ncbi:gamma-glutamyl-gamma-aminobutyrate hydrolase family protein [Mesorhizobium sp.]|uniref:gamma-glutamyl-gamma-aminobutyrate hydrolase family protein n=1 Tax=Mesorhizobium sp. TaxID=1871066 RepID=UPI00345A0BF4